MPGSEVVAGLLRASVGLAPGVAPVSATFGTWLDLARTERVLPLLGRVVEQAGDGLTDGQRRTARTAHQEVMAQAVTLEHELLEVDAVLRAARIPFAVLKGVATAHLDHADPSMRQFSDVDVLISPDDFGRACRSLDEAGWAQPYPLPRGHEHFTHAVTFRRVGRGEVDVHQHVAHRALGLLMPTDQLMAEVTPLRVADQQLAALAATDRLIHAAVHAVASRGSYRRLSSVADVLVLAEIHAARAADVLERARAWKVAGLVAHGVVRAYAAAQLPLPDSWASLGVVVGLGPRGLVERAYLSDRRRPVLEELAHLSHMDSTMSRGRYLTGLVLTGEEYSARRHRRGMRAQVRYLWSRVRADRP